MQDRIHIGNGMFWPRIPLPDSLSHIDGQPTLFVNEPRASFTLKKELSRACIVFDKGMLETGCNIKMVNKSSRSIVMLLGLKRTETMVAGETFTVDLHMDKAPGHFYLNILDPQEDDLVEIDITDENMSRPSHLPKLLPPLDIEVTEQKEAEKDEEYADKPAPVMEKARSKPIKPTIWNVLKTLLLLLLVFLPIYNSSSVKHFITMLEHLSHLVVNHVSSFVTSHVCCLGD